MSRDRTLRPLRAGIAIAVLAVLCLGVVKLWPHQREQHLTVDFSRTVSLYPGSTVRILGVSVGKVDTVRPMGTKVRVTLSWDAHYPVPADVHAVIVSPAIVGDRFIQLTPAYDSGARLPDHSFLDQSRTEVPVELDETYAALDQLSTALGPQGANKDGALSRLIHDGARNLDGQGAKLNRSITALSKLSSTFDDSKDELFDSVTQLGDFVSVLDANDAAVRDFNSSLADVSEVLAGERTDLAEALASLAGSLDEVREYVAENRSSLSRTVRGLTSVTKTLATQKQNLAAILTSGPDAITHLIATYDPASSSLTSRGLLKSPTSDDFSLLTNPAIISAYCGLASGQNPDQESTCYDVGRVLQQLAASVPGASGSASRRTSGTPHTTADVGGIETMMGVSR